MVIRGGKKQAVNVVKVVPGDILCLEAGVVLCADCRVTEGLDLGLDEALLTGESDAVKKHPDSLTGSDVKQANTNSEPDEAEVSPQEVRCVIYRGTTVLTGQGRGVVIATGMKSRIGEISDILNSIEVGLTPLQERLTKLGFYLGIGSIILRYRNVLITTLFPQYFAQ